MERDVFLPYIALFLFIFYKKNKTGGTVSKVWIGIPNQMPAAENGPSSVFAGNIVLSCGNEPEEPGFGVGSSSVDQALSRSSCLSFTLTPTDISTLPDILLPMETRYFRTPGHSQTHYHRIGQHNTCVRLATSRHLDIAGQPHTSGHIAPINGYDRQRRPHSCRLPLKGGGRYRDTPNVAVFVLFDTHYTRNRSMYFSARPLRIKQRTPTKAVDYSAPQEPSSLE